MPQLSVLVITHNEESQIKRCLRSISFADEIIVVDYRSTDNTVALARSLGAKVIESSEWPGFGAQKNRALAAATGEWVFSLDADEWIESPLASEIQRIIADPNAAGGYEIPRSSRFCGRIVHYSGWSPDYVLRLFRRSQGRFSADLVHEKVIINGRRGRLKHAIQHNSIIDAVDALDKAERYAAAAAAMLVAKGKRAHWCSAALHGGWALIRTLVFRGGILDGRTGLRVAMYNFRYAYRKWALVANASKTLYGSSDQNDNA